MLRVRFTFFSYFLSQNSLVVRALLSEERGDGGRYRLDDKGNVIVLIESKLRDPSSPFSDFVPWIVGNRKGEIVFSANKEGQAMGWFRWKNGAISPVSTSSIAGNADFFSPALNDEGVLGFRISDEERTSIYRDDGRVLERVVGGGDEVMSDLGKAFIGKPTSNLNIFSHSPSMNDRGDIVFVSDLSAPVTSPGQSPKVLEKQGIGIGIFVGYRRPSLTKESK